MSSSAVRSTNDIAANAGGLLMRLGLLVLMIVLPIAAIYSRRLVFSLMPVGSMLIFLGATMVPGNTVMADARRALNSPVAFAALALIVWFCLSLIWTPFRQPALEQISKAGGTIALTFAVISALPSRSRISNLNLMPIGAGIAAVVAAALVIVAPATIPASIPELEAPTLERAAVGLVLMVWPALAALGVRERWALAGALAVAVTIVAVAVWTPAALAGMAAGALVFSLATSKPRRMARVLAFVFAAIILLAPATPFVAEILFRHLHGIPIALTKAVAASAEFIRANPGRLITGFGYGTLSRAMVGGYVPPGLPPSILLEIWFELGILGAAGFAALVATSFRAAGKAFHDAAPFLLAAITCVLVIAIWGLGALQLWWMTLLGALAIAFSCVLKGLAGTDRPAVSRIRAETQPEA